MVPLMCCTTLASMKN